MAEKYWYGGTGVYAGQWDWDTARFEKNLDAAAAVDKGSGKVGIPCTGHEFAAGDTVTFAGTDNYDDSYEVDSDTTADEIVIVETYAAETFSATDTATSAVTASNWKLCSDDSNTTQPAAGDIVHFDNRAYLNSTTGKRQSADSHCAGSYTGTPDLAGFYVKPTFDGDIGTSGEYVEFEADGDNIILEGSGTYYIKLSAGTGSDADCGLVVVNNKAGGTVYLASLENDGSNVGLFALVIGIAGTLYLDNDCAVSEVHILTNDMTLHAGTGVQDNKNSTIPDIKQLGGTVDWDSPFDVLDVYAGTFNFGTEIAATGGFDGTLLQVYGSGRFIWATADSTKSIIKQFKAFGGVIDGSRSTNSQYKKEIGTGTEISEIWPAATVKLNGYNQNISIASGSKILCMGGRINPPVNSEISW